MIRAYVKYCTMNSLEQDTILYDLTELINDLEEDGIES